MAKCNSITATEDDHSKSGLGSCDVNNFFSSAKPNIQRKITKLSYDLMEECKRCTEDSYLSTELRHELESISRDIRREVVRKLRNGCAPLFVVCKRGCVKIAEYLVTVCEADREQHGLYEVPDDRTYHYVTPLWCAVVAGQLPVVKYLIYIGCDINSPSDSRSTPVRSACFMTHVEIVHHLVENGANIHISNINGGTCLINSVQSADLCLYLIKRGADVNARDIQEKTALHYAIQEHRLETTKLLLQHGADPYAKSRYGDDALRTACLKGAHEIFDYLKANFEYTAERVAEAHELMGSTFLDEQNETRVAILHWRLAHHIRSSKNEYIEKRPRIPLRPAYANAEEFSTLEELDNISTDVDAMRMQSLLICERILGIDHKDTLFRLTYRGASYADSLQLQRCIDLWRLLLEVRVTHFSILHFDTCFAAQALVRLMLDIFERDHETDEPVGQRQQQQPYKNHYLDFIDNEDELDEGLEQLPNEQDEGGAAAMFDNMPHHADVYGVFLLLSSTIGKAQDLLQIRPVYRKQQENFDRILKCIIHIIHLLIRTSRTPAQKKMTYLAVRDLVDKKVGSACNSDSLLHLSVSRLNVIKGGYMSDDNNLPVFPNPAVMKLLIDCGMNVNTKNDSKSTPLNVAVQPYNYNNDVIHILLDNGADLDQPNKCNERPSTLIANNSSNRIPLMNYTNLKCLAATAITQYKIPYRNKLPKSLEEFVQQHEP